MSLRTKTSYHPYLVMAFYLGCLPSGILGRIPKSTRYEWSHRDMVSLCGYEWYLQNQSLFDTLHHVSVSRRLLQVNRALLRVIALKRFIRRNTMRVKDHIHGINAVVLNNIRKIRSYMDLRSVLKYLDQPYSWYLKIRKTSRCRLSLFDLCRIRHPSQLLSRETAVIREYCSDSRFLHWPLASVYHQIRRDTVASFHISTFYKYIALLDLKRKHPGKRRKNHDKGIRATRPLQIIHADVTIFRTADNQKSYIYLIQDNYSRAILAHQVLSREYSAAITLENLRKVREQYLEPAGIEHCQLISDDGSENAGPVTEWVKSSTSPSIEHLIAQRDIVFSNSMIEAANKHIKYGFLYRKHILDYDHLVPYVAEAIVDFSTRPHDVLDGLTPVEVLKGQAFDQIANHQQIALAKERRTAENKKTRCCQYSF